MQSIPPNPTLQKLIDGNRRFVEDRQELQLRSTAEQRLELADGQSPFAVIITCSDSRVPTEMVFDQGLGDLFVIRVAGNVINPEIVGSVEFAVGKLGSRLVVVMGHTHCGAIQATIEHLTAQDGQLSPGLSSIIDRIQPTIEPLLAKDKNSTQDATITANETVEYVNANTRASVNQLITSSDVLQAMITSGAVSVVGALYSVETGVVKFF